MALAISEIRGVVQRVCARQDVLDACARRDLGSVIAVLNSHGVTQGQIAALTGISQGRLSEWARHKREPRASSTFESFANGLELPPAARQALGLADGSSVAAAIGVLHSPANSELDAGLQYPGTPVEAEENVSALWRADLSGQSALERGLIVPRAWNDASLRWLFASQGDLGSVEKPIGVRVGLGDVERFRDTVDMFRELDNRFGGGHAREALIAYLQGDAVRLLRGRYPDSVGSPLLSAVAEATQLVAWMTYDSAPQSPQAQRYYIQALGLAQAAGDRLLGAGILDSMSHQATYTGRFREAANLAQAARAGTSGVATASLTAHFYTMEARALARLGETKACELALSAAVSEYWTPTGFVDTTSSGTMVCEERTGSGTGAQEVHPGV